MRVCSWLCCSWAEAKRNIVGRTRYLLVSSLRECLFSYPGLYASRGHDPKVLAMGPCCGPLLNSGGVCKDSRLGVHVKGPSYRR